MIVESIGNNNNLEKFQTGENKQRFDVLNLSARSHANGSKNAKF